MYLALKNVVFSFLVCVLKFNFFKKKLYGVKILLIIAPWRPIMNELDKSSWGCLGQRRGIQRA